jgi:hypothetical protein
MKAPALTSPTVKAKVWCWLCPASSKNEAVDSHHLDPVHLGGKKDGPQVMLCPTCHDTLHRESSRIFAGKLPFDQAIPCCGDPQQVEAGPAYHP